MGLDVGASSPRGAKRNGERYQPLSVPLLALRGEGLRRCVLSLAARSAPAWLSMRIGDPPYDVCDVRSSPDAGAPRSRGGVPARQGGGGALRRRIAPPRRRAGRAAAPRAGA